MRSFLTESCLTFGDRQDTDTTVKNGQSAFGVRSEKPLGGESYRMAITGEKTPCPTPHAAFRWSPRSPIDSAEEALVQRSSSNSAERQIWRAE